jgi:hypothetical protein
VPTEIKVLHGSWRNLEEESNKASDADLGKTKFVILERKFI